MPTSRGTCHVPREVHAMLPVRTLPSASCSSSRRERARLRRRTVHGRAGAPRTPPSPILRGGFAALLPRSRKAGGTSPGRPLREARPATGIPLPCVRCGSSSRGLLSREGGELCALLRREGGILHPQAGPPRPRLQASRLRWSTPVGTSCCATTSRRAVRFRAAELRKKPSPD